MPRDGALFCFLGGSETVSSIWDPCRAELGRLGFASHVLCGNGKREAAALRAIGRRIVLVGHSTGGLRLPEVAEELGAWGEAYVAALVPQPGRSFLEQIFEDGEEVFQAEWLDRYRRRTPASRKRLEKCLLHDCPAGSASHLRLQSADISRLYDEVRAASPLSRRPRLYVACNRDRTIRPSWQKYAARRWLQVDPVEMECGHLPQLAMPERLVALLYGFLDMPSEQSPLAES